MKRIREMAEEGVSGKERMAMAKKVKEENIDGVTIARTRGCVWRRLSCCDKTFGKREGCFGRRIGLLGKFIWGMPF